MSHPAHPLAHSGQLTFGGCTGSGPTHLIDDQGQRTGYEPAIAAALARDLDLELHWVSLEWTDMYPTLEAGRIDGILYNQSITSERRQHADFTIPYGNFDESLLVRHDSSIHTPSDLIGRRVGAIKGTTNMRLALSLGECEVVGYDPGVEEFHAMVDALRLGDIDALVDDELYLRQYLSQGFRLAFTVGTGNPYGIAVRRGSALTGVLDTALIRLQDSGELERIWAESFPDVAYRTPELHPERDIAALAELVHSPATVRLNS